MISETLKQFYQEVLEAIENGNVYHTFGDRGLCTTLHNWMKYRGYEEVMIYSVKDEQNDLFLKESRFKICPFNNDDLDRYSDEVYMGTIYKNPKRLAFIKKYAGVKS